jgi:hypothetical protein
MTTENFLSEIGDVWDDDEPFKTEEKELETERQFLDLDEVQT